MSENRNRSLTGGCQCGAVRYRIVGNLGKAGICHCRMCQKAFGNFGAALVSVPAASLAWTRGRPSVFRSSPIVDRGFCAACGTPLHMREDGDSSYEIAIGTLDDPNAIGAMTEQVGIESKVRWFDGMARLPAQKTSDSRSPADLAKLKSLQHPDRDTEHWP
ncbi:MAG: GFA family protein [Rhizobiales bacterium]|nr:GFA family protein [Hyphomicrobiales bacterium]